ncbi:glycoside hydrolase family 3 N-terminal domain-containing protein, partial [Kitasatospora herbaricolor]|uniref:glycoside hydrolase family 3 N-terminal domain-containing protein n=1 Tax=Kitasatospora herbaricolor TaxID=68217 RepID=UPI0036DCFE0F
MTDTTAASDTSDAAENATVEDTDEFIAGLVSDLSLEQKVRLLTGASFWTLHDEPQIGLETIVVSDGPAGVRGQLWDERDSSANLPSPTALAASWDVERVFGLGQLIAAEARRKGVGVALGPTVNIQRSPRGGRHFEAYSEDPWLSGVVGTAFVKGLQTRGVGATPKHYVANDSETDRM